jgi:hypothetical protein
VSGVASWEDLRRIVLALPETSEHLDGGLRGPLAP